MQAHSRQRGRESSGRPDDPEEEGSESRVLRQLMRGQVPPRLIAWTYPVLVLCVLTLVVMHMMEAPAPPREAPPVVVPTAVPAETAEVVVETPPAFTEKVLPRVAFPETTGSKKKGLVLPFVPGPRAFARKLPGRGHRMVYDARRGRVYVSVPEVGRVYAWSAVSTRLVATVPVAPRPTGLCISADESTLYVALNGGSGAAFVDLETLTVSKRLVSPELGSSWAYDVAELKRGFVAVSTNNPSGAANRVVVLTRNASAVATLDEKFGERPTFVAAGRHAFVVPASGSVAVVVEKGDTFAVKATGSTDGEKSWRGRVGPFAASDGKHLVLGNGQMLRSSDLAQIGLVANKQTTLDHEIFVPRFLGDDLYLLTVAHTKSKAATLSRVGRKALLSHMQPDLDPRHVSPCRGLVRDSKPAVSDLLVANVAGRDDLLYVVALVEDLICGGTARKKDLSWDAAHNTSFELWPAQSPLDRFDPPVDTAPTIKDPAIAARIAAAKKHAADLRNKARQREALRNRPGRSSASRPPPIQIRPPVSPHASPAARAPRAHQAPKPAFAKSAPRKVAIK